MLLVRCDLLLRMEPTVRSLCERHRALPSPQSLVCALLSPQHTTGVGGSLRPPCLWEISPKSLQLCCAEPWGDNTTPRTWRGNLRSQPQARQGSGQQEQNVPDLEFPRGSSRTGSSRACDLLIKPAPNTQAASAGLLQREKQQAGSKAGEPCSLSQIMGKWKEVLGNPKFTLVFTNSQGIPFLL